MKMGIKEFRERIGEVALGDELVVLTHHGKRVGRYVPERRNMADDIDMDAWVKRQEAFAREWRSATPDWREKLRAIGEPDADIAAADADDRAADRH